MSDTPTEKAINEPQVEPVEGEILEPEVTAEAETEAADNEALQEAQEKIASLEEALLRIRAEQENQRKRLEREVEKSRKYALESFASELLPIKDSLEMGLDAATQSETTVETLREGSELILKMLDSALEKAGIQEINPVGEKFNPEWHEAMSMAPTPDAEPNTVIHVHQKGYQLNDRLLRAALVIVAQAAP